MMLQLVLYTGPEGRNLLRRRNIIVTDVNET